MGKILLVIIGGSLLFSAYYLIGIVLLVGFLPFAVIVDIRQHFRIKRHSEIYQLYFDQKITIFELNEMLEREELTRL